MFGFNIAGNLPYIIAFVLAIGIAVVFLKPHLESYFGRKSSEYEENVDLSNDVNGRTAILYFFYATWCPHSRSALPEWDKIVDKYTNKNINGYLLQLIPVDSTNETAENAELMNNFNVDGFPTLKLVKDDAIIEFNAKANFDNIDKFLTSVLM